MSEMRHSPRNDWKVVSVGSFPVEDIVLFATCECNRPECGHQITFYRNEYKDRMVRISN